MMHNVRVSHLNVASFDLFSTDSELVIGVFRQVINLYKKRSLTENMFKVSSSILIHLYQAN